MAIKERKQITGTTEQINAYAGHEGQIVWDKEKKTFVGMSGIAGTNYPLAPKEYVDNEVAKVKPTGEYATTAQLTEGLAGKENKGVCLPKTGGLLSGHINLDPNFEEGSIVIGFSFNEKLGGGLDFRSIHDSENPGGFALYATNSTGTTVLDGRPDGGLAWGDQEIERIVQNNRSNLIRYSSGIQIFYIRTKADPDGYTLTFSAPFSSAPIAVATYNGTSGGINVVTTCSKTTVTLKTNVASSSGGVYVIAIGRWK